MPLIDTRWSLVQSATFVMCCLAAGLQDARGGELRFRVEDLPDGSAAWLPNRVIIPRQTDLSGGPFFLPERPTGRIHIFFVDGLQEQMVDGHEGNRLSVKRTTS